MKNKKLVFSGIFGIVVTVLLILGLFFVDKTEEYIQQVSNNDPTDITMDFYDQWLDATQSTSTTPYQSGLAKAPILSKTLSDRLVATPEDQEVDPVLCQNIPPTKIASREIFAEADKTQILVLSKEPKQIGQAVFVLSRLDGGWYIDDILCSQGESDTPHEFSFEHEGGIYKGGVYKSVQPLDGQNYWSLLYTQNTKIYTAQLIFSPDSMCIDLTGSESICNPDQFIETKVKIQGNMSERGVEVQQLSFL